MRLTVIILTIAYLTSCASGSSVVVGDTNPVIQNWESVTITNVMPEGARTIALVKASSAMGATKQGSVNYAINELKQQAAKVGANTVVIGPAATQITHIGMPVYTEGASGGLILPEETEVIQGLAVYVDRNQRGAQERAQAVVRNEQQEMLEQSTGPDKYERLLKLGQLRDADILTEEEFQKLKKEILAESY